MNDALRGTFTAVLNANGTAIVSPSTHAYPEVEIVPAVQMVGTLMTANTCESSVAANPSGADTVTANWTANDSRGTVVPSVYESTETECPDASYV